MEDIRTFTYGELSEKLKTQNEVAYCYLGRERRGTIAFLDENDSIIIVSPNNYLIEYHVDDGSKFELWSFIHEMKEEEDFETRQEAVSRLFDVYCIFYNEIQVIKDYQFRLE